MEVINNISIYIAMVLLISHIVMCSTNSIKESIQISKHNKSLLMKLKLVIAYCIFTVT